MEQTKSLFEQYIETISARQARINAAGMWKWARQYADLHNLSIEQMDRHHLVGLLNSQHSVSPATIRGNVLILRNFFRWLQSNAFREDNPADLISYHDVDYSTGCRVRYFQTYTEVLMTLNKIWTPDEGQATYPLTIFAWQGIPIADAPRIQRADIDLAAGVVNHPSQDRYNRMSTDMIDVLRRYESFTRAKRDNRITMLRNYGSSNFLYCLDMENRESQPDAGAVVNVATEFKKAKQCFELKGISRKFVYSDISKSGALHRMYVMECEGEPPEAIERKARSVLKIPTAYPGDLQLIYQAYKKAFNLN